MLRAAQQPPGPPHPVRIAPPAVRAVTGVKLAGLATTEEQLRAYLNAAQILPVRPDAVADNLKIYVKDSLKKKAFDKWLSSQWRTAAPGLAALQKLGVTEVKARWVIGLSDKLTPDGEIVVTPDPAYKAHIQEI